MAYALIARNMDTWAYKAAVGLALAAGFVMGWSTMVHMSETENHIFLLYFGVLAIGAVGAALARLEARGLAHAVFAMSAALIVTWFLTRVIWSDTHAGPAWKIAILHAGAVLVFAFCGLLFRRASLEQAK
jgi:peptidoglycan/LPS O-acetylase OafA/YrhL